jgi:hypothetical protein
MNMKQLLAIGVSLFLMGALAGVASAASPAERDCALAGGTYTFSKGDATCTFIEETNPGNPNSDNAATPFTETDTATQPGQGGGQGETGPNNQNFEEVDGPVTNPGGNVPGGQN